MITNFQRTADWLAACNKTPCNATHLSVAIGVHLEEICELLQTIRIHEDNSTAHALRQSIFALAYVSTELKAGRNTAYIPEQLRVPALDALCDSEVTGNGVAYLAGFSKPEADRRVLAANDDKLIDGKPVILPGGKIGKRDGWTAPNLEDLV